MISALTYGSACASHGNPDVCNDLVELPTPPPKIPCLRDNSGPREHPLHQGKTTKLKKPKKVTTDISDSIFQEFGVVIPIASHKYSRRE